MYFANLIDLQGYYKGIFAGQARINTQFAYVWADFQYPQNLDAKSGKHT